MLELRATPAPVVVLDAEQHLTAEVPAEPPDVDRIQRVPKMQPPRRRWGEPRPPPRRDAGSETLHGRTVEARPPPDRHPATQSARTVPVNTSAPEPVFCAMIRIRNLLLIAVPLLAACNDWPVQETPAFRVLTVDVVANGLNNPVHVASPPGDTRLFVVERAGVVRIVENGTVRQQPFLDASSEVSTFGSERGMLSIVFHPQYAANRRFFVSYTGNDGNIHLAEYRASTTDPNVASAATRTSVLSIPTTGVQHYGGMLAFTPEGYLLMSVGEGGTYSNPGGESQNTSTLLGKLVRLDVDGGSPYTIPPDNPYAGVEHARPEIWALGLRNPWRFSIDPLSQQLYLTDVGDVLYEEVNVVPSNAPGLNYGWNFFEGSRCQFGLDFCSSDEFHAPQIEYPHQPPCSSVTGGIVYRGAAVPEHQGRYFYSDYCLGWIRSFRYFAGTITEQLDWATSTPAERIVSFGEDGTGELYAVSLTGRIFRIGAERSR